MSDNSIAETDFINHIMIVWDNQIRLVITGSEKQDYHSNTIAVFDETASIIPINYTLLSNQESGGNFVIRFVDTESFLLNDTEQANCYVDIDSKDGKITNVKVQIITTKASNVEHCIIHEITHGFGLIHASKLPSVVNYQYNLTTLSEWDRIALKTLYSEELKPGMTRMTALPLARQIILDQIGHSQK